MKYIVKGLFLGASLVLASTVLGAVFERLSDLQAAGAIVFFLITTAFLVSDKISNLLICGTFGLVSMFFLQITLCVAANSWYFYEEGWLMAYTGGFFGSCAAIPGAIVVMKRRVNKEREEFGMNEIARDSKLKLLIYTVISICSFAYFVTPEASSLGVVVFAAVQLACLWFFVDDKKRLWFFLPVVVMALNSFFSANTVWRMPNLIISLVLYSCMFTDFNIKKDSFGWFYELVLRIILPFKKFTLPFSWALELSCGKSTIIKRVALAVLLCVPCVAILLLVLSNADMVFSLHTTEFFQDLAEVISLNTPFLLCVSVVVGVYLFGTVYAGTIRMEERKTERATSGDLLIINILLSAVLLIYTLFSVVQFKYLFAGSVLPDGLTFTEYARKGFFELLALTGVNIAAIIFVVSVLKNKDGKGAAFSKLLCLYLCAVTVLLLVSSFYRMCLYTADDGLTRMRFYVLGFLIFEAVGLFATFIYIVKPKFNIVLVYLIIALTYYTVLNIVPSDSIIANEQAQRFLKGERNDVYYISTLSADAASAMEYLYNNTDDEILKEDIIGFLRDETYSPIQKRWQRINLSKIKAAEILKGIEK